MKTCVIRTDLGPAYIKCLGNPEGPHALACDWIGCRLAEVMGLETFDFALLTLDEDDVPFTDGRESPGPAFITREEDGFTWSGSDAELANLCNPGDVAKLVVLDTLLRNRDRMPPAGHGENKDNVFFSQERCAEGKLCILAMDFSHALTFGRELDSYLEHIDHTKDEQIYGLFRAFIPFITSENVESALEAIGRITDSLIGEVLLELPREWEVEAAARRAVRTFLNGRRDYLMRTLRDRLSIAAGPQTVVEESEQS